MWRNAVDKGSPRSYEDSTFERAIHYVFFKKLGRGGEGRLPARQSPPRTGAGPWLGLISCPKHTFICKVTRVAARPTPWTGQCSLAWAQPMQEQQKHASTKRTLIPLSLTGHHVQNILKQGCFHPTYEQQKQRDTQKSNQNSLCHYTRLWSVAMLKVGSQGRCNTSRKASKHQSGSFADCMFYCNPPATHHPSTSKHLVFL